MGGAAKPAASLHKNRVINQRFAGGCHIGNRGGSCILPLSFNELRPSQGFPSILICKVTAFFTISQIYKPFFGIAGLFAEGFGVDGFFHLVNDLQKILAILVLEHGLGEFAHTGFGYPSLTIGDAFETGNL